MKFGFYELQTARDWYREVTSDIGMHVELVRYWIRCAALLVAPIAPHFAEHIWSSPTILCEPASIQLARWPTPDKPVDKAIIHAGVYMRGTIKIIRDAEITLMKKVAKAKGPAVFDPKKPKSVRIYVSTAFPEWQDTCVQIVKDAYDEEHDKVDDVKIRELLIQHGLIKDKRAMPFVQALKVGSKLVSCEANVTESLPQRRIAQFGAETAFRRTLPFSESAVLTEIQPYLKKSLNLVDAEVMSVEEAKTKVGPGFTQSIIESSEPGSPGFEYRNV